MKVVISILAAIILLSCATNCLVAQQDYNPAAQEQSMKGQDRAMLIRAIQVAVQQNKISQAEAKILYQLVEDGLGYPELLQDYIKNYKRRNKSIEQFNYDIRTKK